MTSSLCAPQDPSGKWVGPVSDSTWSLSPCYPSSSPLLTPLWPLALCLCCSIIPIFNTLKFKSDCAQNRMPCLSLPRPHFTAWCPVEASTPRLLPLGILCMRLSANCHLLPVPAETSLFSFPSMMPFTPHSSCGPSLTYYLSLFLCLIPLGMSTLGTRAHVLPIAHSTQNGMCPWWRKPTFSGLLVTTVAQGKKLGLTRENKLLLRLQKTLHQASYCFTSSSPTPQILPLQGQTRSQPHNSRVTLTGPVWSLTA